MNKKIKDVFLPELFSVSPDTPATAAMDIMLGKNISCMVIVEDDQPVGIFTERDIVRNIVALGSGFAEYSIAEVMTQNVCTVTPDSMLYEAYSILAENVIRHLVVVDRDNRALGVITQSDLLDYFEYDYLNRKCSVCQVMNKCSVTVDAYDTVYHAAKIMSEDSLSFLIVNKQSQPEGVITERDIARFAAEDMDLSNTLTKDAMSTPVYTIGSDQPAFMAAEKMHEYDIRHLVVVSGKDKTIGVITQTDLIRGLESKFIDTLKLVIKEQESELDKTKRQLSQKSCYLDSILSSSINLGLAITDQDFIISVFNPTAALILGVQEKKILGHDLRTIPDLQIIPAGRLEKAIGEARNNETSSFTLHRRDLDLVRIIQITLSGLFDQGSLSGFLFMVEDITDKRLAEETIHRLAYYDTLTGMPNRSMFYDKLRSELARSRRHDSPFGIILMDIDHFKMINDTLGHQAGDRLLRQIAKRLDGLLRESDTIARLGGDEFCFILVSTTTTNDALITAEKIIQQLSPSYDLDGATLQITFSLVVAMFPVHGEDEETLLKNTTAAMCQSKELGRKNKKSNVVIA